MQSPFVLVFGPMSTYVLTIIDTYGMTLPGQTTGMAVFCDRLAADLGLTRPQVALAYTA